MRQKFTPGPWELIGNAIMPSPDSKVPDTMLGIAQIYTFDGERSDEKTQANARLIATAPELLAALIEIEAEKSDYMRINNLGDPAEQHTNKMARAAIAKALGEG